MDSSENPNSAFSMFDLPLSATSMLSSSWSLPSATSTEFSELNFEIHSFLSKGSHNEQVQSYTNKGLPESKSPNVGPSSPYDSANTHSLAHQPTSTSLAVDYDDLDFSSLASEAPFSDTKPSGSETLYHDSEYYQAKSSPDIFPPPIYTDYSSLPISHDNSLNTWPSQSFEISKTYAPPNDAILLETSSSAALPSFTSNVPDSVLPDQEPRKIKPPPKILRSMEFPVRQHRRSSATPSRSSPRDGFQLRKVVPLKYSDAKPRDDANIIILQARAEQRGYAEIQKLIHQHTGVSMADSTIRGRFRTLTVPPADRLREVKWTELDVRTAITQLGRVDGFANFISVEITE
jgi:hypothetical protein